METITIITTNADSTHKGTDCTNAPIDLIGKLIISIISTFYAGNHWILFAQIIGLPSKISWLF